MNRVTQWLSVPRDTETIHRSLTRKFSTAAIRSSAPFLSGDTFKLASDIVLQGNFMQELSDAVSINMSRPVRVFSPAGPMSDIPFKLSKWLSANAKFYLGSVDLIIHNGDSIPNTDTYTQYASRFRRVHSVNWLGDSAITNPLPIGLENSEKQVNGVPADYLKIINRGLRTWDDRDITLLICFSLSTNPVERNRAMQVAKDIPGSYIVEKPITPRRYRDLVCRSRFVLSPPGNGPDCHRTWEAVYLGATPIVSQMHWGFLHHNLPVLPVRQWVDVRSVVSRFQSIEPTTINWSDVNYWLEL